MQSNVKRPVSAHHTFRAKTRGSRGTQVGVGGKLPLLWFWSGCFDRVAA